MKNLLRPLISTNMEQRIISHKIAKILGKYYSNKFSIILEIIDSIKKPDISNQEIRIANETILNLCKNDSEFSLIILSNIHKFLSDPKIHKTTQNIFIKSLAFMDEKNLLKSYHEICEFLMHEFEKNNDFGSDFILALFYGVIEITNKNQYFLNNSVFFSYFYSEK